MEMIFAALDTVPGSDHLYVTLGGYIIIALIGAIATVLTAVLPRLMRDTKASRVAAETTVENTESVSNGRIPRIEQILERIEVRIDGMHSELQQVRREALVDREAMNKHIATNDH